MSAEDWSQVTELFRRALDLPEAEREAFLRGASFDPGVRDQVAALLVGDAGAERGGFLRPPGTDESLRSAVPDPHFAARRGIHLRCPQCQHPIEVVETRMPAEFTCEYCGTTIRTGVESTGSAGSRPGDTLRWEPSAALRSFGRFTLIHWVGEGAFGIVYKARDPQVGRIVALKVPRLGNLGSEQDREDFLREAKAVGRLRHASIVQVFDAGEVDGTPFIVSDFVEGVTIEDLRKDPGPAPDFRSCARIAAELADALQHAHDRGIIHRDVKPSNVMIDRQGLPRLMDFGLAKRGEAELTIAVSGRPMGTPAYMSPEQARGEGKHVDGRTDVYGLGALLYYLIAGSAPFAGTERMILLKVIHDEPPPPRSLNERIPRDLQTICQAAMAKEPSRRYATARDLAADLRRFLDGRTITRRPAGPLEKAWRACARNPRLSLAIGTASAALVAVAVVSTLLAVATHRSAVARARDLSRAHQHAALQLLERGEIGPGLLWMERALGLAEDAGDVDLAHSARANIAAWSREHPPLRSTFAHPAEVRRAVLSPDGKSLLAACADGTAQFWDVAGGGPIAGPLRHGRKVRSVAYSPDGRLALTAGEDGEIRLWDASTGRVAGSRPSGAGFALREAAFGEGGRTIVAVGQDGTFRRWETATGRPLGGVIGQPWATTTAAAISPGGRWGLVATLADDGTREVRLWDLASGLPVGGPLGHGDAVRAVAFSPDEKAVATGCGDSRVRVWDVATAAPIVEIPDCHYNANAGLCFSPDGTSLLVSTGERTARVFDVATRLFRGDVLRTGARTNVAAFSPDGRMVATGGGDGRARLWDARTGTPIGLALPHQADVTHLAFLPDAGSILVCSGEKAARIWSVDASTTSPVALAVPGKINVAARSPDGAIVAVGNDLGEVLLRDGIDGRPIRPPWQHREAVKRLAFAGDGKALLVGGEHGRVQLWRVADGQPIGPVHAMKGWIVAAAFSRDGSTAVVASEDGPALVIDARSGRARGPMLLHGGGGGAIQVLGLSADGSLVATGSSDDTVRLWDGRTGGAIGGPLRHDGDVEDLAVGPDGTKLITADREGPARIWDVASGRLLARLEHDGPVITVKFSPDGLTALTGGFDAKVRLWDVESGRRKGPILSGPGDVVFAAAFSEDSRLIAIGCRNGDVRLWDASTGLRVGPRWNIPDHRVEDLAFHPGRIAIMGRGDDSAARLWIIPRPDSPDVSGLTGLKLDERDEVVTLDGPILKDRRARRAAANP